MMSEQEAIEAAVEASLRAISQEEAEQRLWALIHTDRSTT